MQITPNQSLVESLESALETFSSVDVTFTTKRGSERVMRCSRVPKDVDMTGRDDPKLNHPSIIAVYDYQNSAWRSFRKDSVISFEVV